MNEPVHTPAGKESPRGKATVSITLNPDLLKKAHDLGLNVSKICENRLIEAIRALEATNQQSTPSLGSASLEREGDWCGNRDLNPGHQRGRLKS